MINFQACSGEHQIKRLHVDGDDGPTLHDASEWDLHMAGYVKIEVVREYLEKTDAAVCSCPDDVDYHTGDCPVVTLAADFDDRLAEGPAEQ